MLKINKLDKSLLSHISTVKAGLYLKNQGWKKTGEIEGFASTWLLEEKETELLLPLNKEYSDFEARMLEVILILEDIEKRSSFEIIDVLKNTSNIAYNEGREIIEIVLQSVYDRNKHEINADNFGTVLRTTQKHLFALGGVSGLGKRLNEREKRGKSELELSVLSTFHGSFGIRLGLANQRQLDTDNNCLSKTVSKSFMQLLRVSGEESISRFRIYIGSLEKQISQTFRLFIKSVKTLESDLIFDWGSLGIENEEIARLSYSKVLEVEDALNKEEEENPNQIEEKGQFIQAGLGRKKHERDFIFETKTGEKIKGYISPELVEQFKEQPKGLELLNRRYKVIIQVNVKLNEITREIKISNELIAMEEIT